MKVVATMPVSYINYNQNNKRVNTPAKPQAFGEIISHSGDKVSDAANLFKRLLNLEPKFIDEGSVENQVLKFITNEVDMEFRSFTNGEHIIVNFSREPGYNIFPEKADDSYNKLYLELRGKLLNSIPDKYCAYKENLSEPKIGPEFDSTYLGI